jgi:insulysin
LRSIFLSLVLSIPLLASVERIADRSGLEVRTPSLSERQTRKLRLANELEVYLISDPGSALSGAALSMEVGTWQDPDSRPGMAHLTEHMLFLGNAAYPDEEGFRHHLEAHGGLANAGTGEQITYYMFSVQNNAFEEALDRFSHFFVDPLLTDSALGREKNAVHQEFARDAEIDVWREHAVEQEIGSKSHPSSRFDIGNLETLNTITGAEMREWFENHYSANLMHLVVISPESLDKLEQLAIEMFTPIPNRDFEPFAVQGERFSPERKRNILYLEPYQELRSLSLAWEIPYDHGSDMETHAADLVAYALGDEAQGSLAALLKGEGYAENVSSQILRHRKDHSSHFLFGLNVDLTTKGLAERDRVIEQVFGAVAKLQQTGIPAHLQEELGSMNRLLYTYQTREDVFRQVMQHGRGLVQEELATYPARSLLPERYDGKAVGAILSQLQPNDCAITVMAPSKESGVASTHTERWMGGRYALVPIDPRSAEPSDQISPPGKNPFVPSNLKLVNDTLSEEQLPPVKALSNSDWGKFYYAPDQRFGVPEVAYTLRIKSAAVPIDDLQAAVALDLVAYLADEELGGTLYSAKMGGLSAAFVPIDRGVEVRLSGYSEKAPQLLTEILQVIKGLSPSKEEMKRALDGVRRKYASRLREPPLDQALELTKNLLYGDYHPAKTRLEALEKIDRDTLLAFIDTFPSQTYVEGLFFGNLTERQAQNIAKEIRKKFQVHPYPAGAAPTRRIAQFPTEGPYFVEKQADVQGNAAMLVLQEGPFTFERSAAQSILGIALGEPFFSELRTKQQTGYVVRSWSQEIERQLFAFFGVQSTSHAGPELLQRFELFLETFNRDLEEITPPARFNAIRNSLITDLRRPLRNPKEMGALLTQLAFDRDGDFEWNLSQANALEALSYADYVAFVRDTLSRTNRQRIALMIDGTDEVFGYTRSSLPRLRDKTDYEARNDSKSMMGAN